MSVPTKNPKGRNISDEELEAIRRDFRSLTPTGRSKANEIDEKIRRLESAGMTTSANRLKIDLLRLVGSKSARKESAGGEHEERGYAPDAVALAKKQSGQD